jgi:predicted phosphoribosyltransferase
MDALFQDRHDAGRQLATKLTDYAEDSDLIILALSGGGLAVAYEVAKALHKPLDIFLMRNLAAPGHEDASMGVVVSGGATVFNQNVIRPLGIETSVVDEVAKHEQAALNRMEQSYHPGRPPYELENRDVILVDDGLATGTMIADAVTGMRDLGAVHVVIAIPTTTPETYAAYDRFDETDTIICARPPHDYRGVDTWYADSSQTDDDEIRSLLSSAAAGYGEGTAG